MSTIHIRGARPRSLAAGLTLALLLTPGVRAQQTTPDEENEKLRQLLRDALERIDQLETRVDELETGKAEDDLEAQLQALIIEEPEEPPTRTFFPSMSNPQIGVFMDSVIELGDQDPLSITPGDNRFSLRETEIDIRSPISPFAEGTLIIAFEDEGSGDFEGSIEEGYADVALGELLDVDTAATSRIGRFRVPFGTDNVLHTHDLLQTDRPLAVTQQLGEEGFIGDGIGFQTPVAYIEHGDGLGNATTLDLAFVNGSMVAGHGSILEESADEAGLDLDSEDPMIVARLSNFTEITPLSDVQVGASYIHGLGDGAVEVEGEELTPTYWGLDASLRLRDDESGVGGWLLHAETIHTRIQYPDTGNPDFPEGTDKTRGWWVTAQRQMSPTVYTGLRYGMSDVVATKDAYNALSPYITWYADEFFRIRVQGQRLEFEPDAGNDSTTYRAFVQFTWNFGAHPPHPWWVNL